MPGSNENARWLLEQASQDQNKMVIEGIDEPTEEQRTARDVQIQQRGGLYHDTIKIDPFQKGYKAPSRRDPIKRA